MIERYIDLLCAGDDSVTDGLADVPSAVTFCHPVDSFAPDTSNVLLAILGSLLPRCETLWYVPQEWELLDGWVGTRLDSGVHLCISQTSCAVRDETFITGSISYHIHSLEDSL